jgi:hypothetical protein
MRDIIKAIGQWLDSNKEWVFSGAGVSAILVVVAILRFVFSRPPKPPSPSPNPVPPPHRPRIDIIRERGFVRLGYFEYPPLICVGRNQCPGGIYGAIASDVFSKLGVSVEWHQINVGHAVAHLQDGFVDCVVCVFQTAERAKYTDFVSVLHTVTVTGVVRATN